MPPPLLHLQLINPSWPSCQRRRGRVHPGKATFACSWWCHKGIWWATTGQGTACQHTAAAISTRGAGTVIATSATTPSAGRTSTTALQRCRRSYTAGSSQLLMPVGCPSVRWGKGIRQGVAVAFCQCRVGSTRWWGGATGANLHWSGRAGHSLLMGEGCTPRDTVVQAWSIKQVRPLSSADSADVGRGVHVHSCITA